MTRAASALAWCTGPAAAASAYAVPTAAPAWVAHPLRLAHDALARGDVPQALVWFDAARAASPRHAVVANLGRAVCLLEMGRPDEGEVALEEAYAASERPGEVDYALARMSALSGETQGTFGLLGLALRLDPARANEAKNDNAFANVRDHPQFLQLIGEL